MRVQLAILSVLIFLLPVSIFQSNAQSLTLQGATVHVGDGQVFENGYVRIEGSKITAVGAGLPPAGVGTVVPAKGKHIYPGIILPNNTLGLDEVGAVRATHDYAETGPVNPNARAITAYNAASVVIPTVRSNGVLSLETTPRGNGPVWGTSALVQLDALTPNDAVLVADLGIHIAFPQRFTQEGWWAEPGATKPNENFDKELATLTQLFADARSYAAQPVGGRVTNLKLAAMQGLFTGKLILFIHAGSAREIMEGVLLAKREGVQRIVINTGQEGVKVASFLKEQQVPVVLSRIHGLPAGVDDDYDIAFTTAAKLKAAGVLFCLDMEGDMEPMHARNLATMAGTATGFGLTDEQALEAVTASAARILGVGDRLGRLSPGLEATLFIADGPALDLRTLVEAAYIQGRTVNLDTRQKQLYRSYATRYGLPVKE